MHVSIRVLPLCIAQLYKVYTIKLNIYLQYKYRKRWLNYSVLCMFNQWVFYSIYYLHKIERF